MGKFCGNCGAPLSDTSQFCAKCGTQTGQAPDSAKARPADPAPAPQAEVAAKPKGMSAGAKLAIAALVIIFVGGAAAVTGVFYVAHRVSEKFHEVKDGITGNASPGGSPSSGYPTSSTSTSGGDPCRYLNKRDVGQAIGVEIVETRMDGESCSYLAKGSEGEMAAKHAAAMTKAKGADEKSQKIFEQFGSAIFNSMPQEKQDRTRDASGNVPVLGFSVSDSPSAIAEMKLNAKVLKNLGGVTGEDLDIGDQAFVSSDSMIMVRKGGKVIRIMYMTCPCGTKEVIPLAKKLVQSL
jgi:zinc-ribbon domain